MAITPEQRLERQNYIGGSDIAAILGESRYASPLDIYLSKTEPLPPEDNADAKNRGNLLEPIIIDYYKKNFNCDIAVTNNTIPHPKYPFLRANIDGLTADGAIIEAKSVAKWAHIARDFGQEGTDNIPVEYLFQCAFYCEIVPNVNKAVIPVAFVNDNSGTEESIQKVAIYEYMRNEQLGQGIIQHAVRFWEDHVLKRVPPPGESLRAKANPITKSKIITPELAAIYSEMRMMKEQIEMLQKSMEGNKEKLIEYLDEFESLKDESGKELVTWRDQLSNRFDIERFKAEHPDLYKQYIKQTNSRIFRLKGERE